MIDMSGLFSHSDYDDTVNCFNHSNCDWSIFKSLHRKVSNNKCPICEVELNNTLNHNYAATIDHFRPKAKDMYPHLKCESKNYILMCCLCNTRYKESKFPLVDEAQRAITARCIEETGNEQPLLFNPAEEDPLYFFELAFRQTEVGNILELKRKSSIPKNSYDYQRCEMMIKLFGLGYVHKEIHPDEATKNLRLDVLRTHYETFIDMAQAINTQNKKTLALILKNKNRNKEMRKYGFYQFLLKKQFRVYF